MDNAIAEQVKIQVGDVLVATWGYSMTLTTWVKVVKVSPKTLLVAEICSRNATQEEMQAHKLQQPGYLQLYSVPTETIALHNGEPKAQFRLYETKGSNGERWHGYPDKMSTRLYFRKWDGRPQYENHCD